jgi:hypothetical protein
MLTETLDWKTVNWRKVYLRSQRAIELRGFSVDYFSIRAVGWLLFLSCAFVAGIQINWDWISTLVSLVVFTWLGWLLWPVIEKRWASRFVLKARVEQKLEAPFWQREMRPVIIVVQQSFRITPKGQLIEARDWLGNRRVNIPAWLLHIIEQQEEVDLVCLSTRRILGRLEEFSNP